MNCDKIKKNCENIISQYKHNASEKKKKKAYEKALREQQEAIDREFVLAMTNLKRIYNEKT